MSDIFTMRNILPDRVFLRVYAARSAQVWMVVHVVLAVLTGGDVIVLPALSAAVLLLVAGAVGILDARRRSELLFLQNLGVSPAIVAACCMPAPAALEVLLAIAMANLGYSR